MGEDRSIIEAGLTFLEGKVINEGLAPGAQLARWSMAGSDVAIGAVGSDAIGEPLNDASMFATYCMGKPLVALCYAHLVADGEVSFDDKLGDILDCSKEVGGFTVADYLGHRVEISIEDSIAAVLLDQTDYRRRLLNARARARSVPQYSEFAAWQLLSTAAQALTCGHLTDYVKVRILRPLNLEDQVHIAHWRTAMVAHSRVNGAVLRPHFFSPLLSERCAWFDWTQNPGFGGYMTIRASVSLFADLLSSILGQGSLPAWIAQRLVEAGPVHDDAVLARQCQFGLGVFANMQLFGLEKCTSPHSFGQMGLMGMSGVVADLDSRSVFGYHVTAYSDINTMNGWLRPALCAVMSGITPKLDEKV